MSNPSSATAPALWHHHRLQLRTTLGALALEIDLDLTSNWTVIFGPSGSGKSSILRALAGLLPNTPAGLTRQDKGCNKQDLTHLPPRDRRIAYAPQQPSLFPHLNVADNVAFAQKSSRSSTPSAESINDAIKLFRLEDLVHRYPRNLSGGERQRVNLARAFAVPHPQLMLLDEPFNGIDRPLRDAILPELRETLRLSGIPVVSVTHDVEEAFRLQAEVVILGDGRILDQGYVSKVLAEERLNLLIALK
ncbi:MAG TPA: ATP-binding cassette domain-containing protein [Acidobacteriaceae bacterium]|nr:ATP-binding cassette domain-containing protein [Acidobacteriaceae bacterium]